MNCEEFELAVCELAHSDVGGRSVEPSRGEHEHAMAQAMIHVEVDACASCAVRLQEERLLSRKLESVASAMNSFEPPARIEAALLNALRQNVKHSIDENAGLLPASSIRRKSEQQHDRVPAGWRVVGASSYWLTAAAAVVVLIVFGVVLVRAKLSPANLSRQPDLQANDVKTPPRDSAAPIEKPSGSDETEFMTAKDSPANDNHEIAVRRERRRPQRLKRPSPKPDRDVSPASLAVAPSEPQTTESQEVTTQFIALGYVAPANLQDGGQIVRVELPRSAMASFGLPVNMDRFGERVKADVLVSADGFARAIRFVQ